MSNLDLEYRVRAEQYRDIIQAASRHHLLVEAGLVPSARAVWADRTALIKQWASEQACRLPLMQSRPYCQLATKA